MYISCEAWSPVQIVPCLLNFPKINDGHNCNFFLDFIEVSLISMVSEYVVGLKKNPAYSD